MQGAQVRSLVREVGPTCRATTKSQYSQINKKKETKYQRLKVHFLKKDKGMSWGGGENSMSATVVYRAGV